MRRTLRLPRSMRGELKRPLGMLLRGEDAARGVMELLEQRRPRVLAVVGDTSTRSLLEAGLKPDIVVVDYRVMRRPIEPYALEGRRTIRARNPAGTIDEEAWMALEEAVTLKKGVAVIVEGEEDLLVLPLIALLPTGSLIVYGQPHEGLVAVEVTAERKRWAEEFMGRMEEAGSGAEGDIDQG
ncbi:MAG: hypothetical protein AYL28_003800 [Candidatus Bathyarchaeota archaeon B23]|nr:MAG: hypothetical protein AYL28_003800 [Candidatus Bathyarchaeota archaeon B23]